MKICGLVLISLPRQENLWAISGSGNNGGAPEQVILSQENGADWIMLDAQGILQTSLKGGTRLPDLNSGVMLNSDTWQRVGFVWDGESRILYVDDVEVARDDGCHSGFLLYGFHRVLTGTAIILLPKGTN